MATVPGSIDRQDSSWPTAPIVDALVPQSLADRRPMVSLIFGLAGTIGTSLLCCFGAGTINPVFVPTEWDDELLGVVLTTTVLLVATLCYVTTLIALHTIASCLLPLSVRLTVVFAVIYGGLRLATWSDNEPVQALHAIMLMPFCIGGFFQRRIRGWRALALNQIPEAKPLTILGLLDVTTAVALTLALLTTTVNWADIGPVGLLVFAPSSLLMMVIGMHCWSRLCILSPISAQADSGNGIWLAINHSNAFFILIGFLAIHSQSRLAFLAFIVAPMTVLVAHIGTEIPIRWLRGSGWRFERVDQTYS